MDPRVEISDEALRLQTENTMACYRGYLAAQDLREAIEAASLAEGEQEAWSILCGARLPGAADTLYGSIYETSPEEETVMGLQQKFLYMMTLLQQADARPTAQAIRAVEQLRGTLQALSQRWAEIR
jgi:hypothetical protein